MGCRQERGAVRLCWVSGASIVAMAGSILRGVVGSSTTLGMVTKQMWSHVMLLLLLHFTWGFGWFPSAYLSSCYRYKDNDTGSSYLRNVSNACRLTSPKGGGC